MLFLAIVAQKSHFWDIMQLPLRVHCTHHGRGRRKSIFVLFISGHTPHFYISMVESTLNPSHFYFHTHHHRRQQLIEVIEHVLEMNPADRKQRKVLQRKTLAAAGSSLYYQMLDLVDTGCFFTLGLP